MMKSQILGMFLGLLAGAAFGGTPAIIPLPQQMQVRAGTFTLCPSQAIPGAPAPAAIRILANAASLGNAQYLAALLFRSTGFQFQIVTNAGGAAIRNAIVLTTVNANTNLGAEGYELTVVPDSVLVRATGQAGVFYGLQSLLQLLPPQILSPLPVRGVSWTAPCVYIYDLPRFPWRGWMLDVSRHFLNKDDVKAFLDVMALHKLNTLHWHLVDDQGWRVEILSYPLLTQIGAWRNTVDYGLNPSASPFAFNAAGQYGGFYTQNDVREIVAYASERHINIVPEVELPAHSTSGLASYPQFGCDNPVGVYNMDTINYHYDLYSLAGPGCMAFFQGVLTELMGLFPSQYIHCGGDEVVATFDKQWLTNTYDVAQMQALGISTNGGNASIIAYQHWFSTNIASFLQSSGRTMMGWTEIEAGGTVINAVLTDWETGSSSAALATAEAGQYVVMTPETNCYMNYYMTTNVAVEPYFEVGSSPAYLLLDAVYNFEPIPAGLPAQYNSFILGAEGTEFAEFIPGLKNVELKALPRMCAMAEVTWTPAAMKNYTNFTQRLATQEQRLAQMGANYDLTNAVQIGTWAQPVSTNATTVNYDITANVTKAGEIDVDFHYTTGADGLWIYSAALLVNGVPVDTQTFTTFSGAVSGIPTYRLPVFVLHLANFKPGATYTIQASIASRGGTASNGTVYLTNWN